jgi:hypothetical protein
LDPRRCGTLAAIGMLFGWLVVGQVMATNPAAPVREQWYPENREAAVAPSAINSAQRRLFGSA